ncbi:zinc finger protein 468-like [Periplaneta americana]|uniref:zinc finger protein 468-like n=1 Tax=Periplaneta americana TaxID=6978 RepID=UPI0037E9C4F1
MMDVIKVEPDIHLDVPLSSDNEDDAAPEPFAFVAIKQEVEGSWEESISEQRKLQAAIRRQGIASEDRGLKDSPPGGSSDLFSTCTRQPLNEYRGSLKSGVKCYKYIITEKGQKRYLCLCGKTYLRIGDLVKHTHTHSGIKPYTCDVCNKTFTKNDVLREHYRSHTGVKPYACDLCDKRFSKTGNLAVHRRIHTGEKNFTCDVCNKRFLLKAVLKLHYRIHTGEKPYKCSVCDRAFARSGHLASHQLTHTGEKQFNCDVCSKKFSQKQNLQRHSRTHLRQQFKEHLNREVQ